MDTKFIYSTYVTGRNFIGRKAECNSLGNLLRNNENVVIYEPPKSGKQSLVQQTLFNMHIAGEQFAVCQTSLFNKRNIRSFLTGLGTAAIRSCYSTPSEYEDAIRKFLDGTHFIFDRERFSGYDEIVCMEEEPDGNDMERMLRLPYLLSKELGTKMIVIISEFQNLMEDPSYETVFGILKDALEENTGAEGPGCCFVFSGSRVNAMKYIFEEYKYFHRLAVHIPLHPIDEREIAEHVLRGFQSSGKVIGQDMISQSCRLFRGNMWYINQYMDICDSITKGYINEGILIEALRMMLSVHEARFMRIMDSLTGHQTSLLKAIMDGVVKFSASDVIDKYSLNSSANVRRVKDALRKKEIITFTERDEPVILDPLFEYWLGKYYFEIPGLQ